MDMCSNLRRAYQTVAKISEAVTTDLIKGKVEERQDGLVPFILQVLESLKFESEIITENQFMRELAQVEKHALVSFANLTFNTQFPQKQNRHQTVIQEIKAAIANVDLTVEAAKQLLTTALELHTPDMDLFVPPRDPKAWNRFRNGVNSFYEVVIDPAVSMKSVQELLIAQSELREEIKYLEYELGEAKPFKERFEALEKAQPPEYEKLMTTLKKQVSTFKEDALRAKNDLAKSK